TMIRGTLYGIAKKYLPYIPEEYVIEMKTLAESSGVSFDEILLANTAPETFIEAESLLKTGFCTSTVLNNEMTFDGSLFHLYNVDMYFPPKGAPNPEAHYKKVLFFDKYKTIYFYQPQKGNSFITSFVCSFTNVFGGMNEHGICISFMGPFPHCKRAKGIPIGFQIRSILQNARTLTQAVDMAKSARWALEGQIVISDGKANNAVLINFGPEKCSIKEPENGKLVRGFGEVQINELLSIKGYDRKLTLGSLINLLRHQPYDWHGICSKATAYSVVFHPSTGRFWLAIGNAPSPAGTYYGFDLLKQSRLTKDSDDFNAIYPYSPTPVQSIRSLQGNHR
ncbi:MAG: C45 family autoproteolytic acyltransferase/hydrolase, partial [Planctomycetota bacterium]|nr:C45 family autoproteolytic acyltransferase/hydrolase [Planctomycetota bacterium]